MNNIGQKYLPIGSVVMLKGGSKRVMISGFCITSADEQNKMYDYSGCMFPEGILSGEQIALFNHNQIEKIHFVGLNDEEEKLFKVRLNSLVAQINQDENSIVLTDSLARTQMMQNIDEVPLTNNILEANFIATNDSQSISTQQNTSSLINLKFDE